MKGTFPVLSTCLIIRHLMKAVPTWAGPDSMCPSLPQEGQKLFHTCPRGSPEVEGVLRELVGLWEELQRKHQENGAVLREIDKVCGTIWPCRSPRHTETL